VAESLGEHAVIDSAREPGGDSRDDDRKIVDAGECHGEFPLPRYSRGYNNSHTLVRLISMSSSSRVTGTEYSASRESRCFGKYVRPGSPISTREPAAALRSRNAS